MKTVLSIQAPAPCPVECAFCRTPEHNLGDPEKVLKTARENMFGYKEVYLTSNGETGLSPIFGKLVALAKGHDLPVAVLCATDRSVIFGLSRVEISLNEFTKKFATRAIEKARYLGIPTVISMVDTRDAQINLEAVAKQYGVDGVLVRALQPEGRSDKSFGLTRKFIRAGAKLGQFPVAAYRELVGLGSTTTCINHNGFVVPLLGGV